MHSTEEEVNQVIAQDDKALPEFWRNKYEEDARRSWDVFYRINRNNFFKDVCWRMLTYAGAC
jgi:hypothetical protein